MKYRDSDPCFWALAVAWEATRFAWYVLSEDPGTARGKLQLTEKALSDYKRIARLDDDVDEDGT
jgi:hypothetical protein